jgi:two-component system sensor histidine kinase QseC
MALPGLKDALGSLRVRLAAAMLMVLVLALGASSLLDRLWQTTAVPADAEPYQDATVLAIFSVVVIALVWMVSLWSLRPVARAAREAGEAGPAHPGARISAAGLPTEIRPLVASVNAALDRMEAAYDAERRFTVNAAHELRTPLAVLSLRLQQAQVAGEADWPGITADLRHMTRLVSQLLDLARKEQAGREAPAGKLPVLNLSRIAREAAAAALPLAEAANRQLHVDLPDDLPIRGRADDMRDAVLNLLDNAIKHGAGDISLSAGRSGAGCHLDVADQGGGPPPALREFLFERFRKAEAGTDGSGLGLAIVREVARGHGGEARFVAGGNCVIRIELPEAGARS